MTKVIVWFPEYIKSVRVDRLLGKKRIIIIKPLHDNRSALPTRMLQICISLMEGEGRGMFLLNQQMIAIGKASF